MTAGTELFTELAKFGVLGILLAISILWHWRKEREIERLHNSLNALNALRTSDAQQMAKELIALGSQLGQKVTELNLLVSELNRIVKDDREDVLGAVRRLFRDSLTEMRTQSGMFRALAEPDPEGGKES